MFDLKKFLEDAVKNINPFGLGTALKANQAVQQIQKAQPASTAQKNVVNEIGNFGKDLVSGIQQGIGNVGDIALMGGANLAELGNMTNPLINEQRRQQNFGKSLKNTEMFRNQIKDAKTVTGQSYNPKTDFQFTGDIGRDAADLAGRGLQTGLDATMFLNPAKLATGAVRPTTTQLLKFAGKDAALFGGGQGAADFGTTYAQTGDLRQAAQQGVKSALLSGVTQGALDLGGAGLRVGSQKAVPVVADTARNVQTAYANSPIASEAGFARVPGKELELPIVGTNLSKAVPASTAIEVAPTARSSFANNTVQRSQEVSDPLKGQVKSNEPTFQTVTDVDRITRSEEFVKKTGLRKATTDVRQRLASKNIDDQTVSDTISLVKALDSKPSEANLLESSDLLESLSVKLSKAGQTVQAASLLNNRTPAGLQFGAIRTLKKAGVEVTDKIKKDIGDLIDVVRKEKPGSYEDGLARFKLQDYVSKAVPSANTSKAIQLWKAGLLTSPRTTAGNLAGNFAESVFNKGYVDPLANIIDNVFAIFTGDRSRKYTLRGIGSGTKEGIEKGISYFKTGYDPRNPAQKFDVRQIHYSDKPLGKAAEAYTQTVFKLMGVADQPFYYASLRNSLYDQALTRAENLKLKGPEKSAFIKKFVTEPEKKAMQLADAEARYNVFQNETALGKAASRIKNMEGLPGDVAEFVIPFSGVPSSIATRMIERTPIGWATALVKARIDKKAGRAFDQRALTKALANGSAAIPLIGAGYALANNGLMTLGYPTEKKERDLWEAEGKQPYSIRVGDQWLSLNYFQPAGNLMAAGAEYAGALLSGKTPEQAFSQSLAGAGKAFSEQSFLKGVSSIGNAISDPSRFGQTFSESTAGSLIPNVIRTGARAFDPVKREVDNIGEAVIAGVPGLRGTLQPKTNILGEEVQRNSNPINEIFNPTKPSDVQNEGNPVIQELRRLQDAGEGIVPTEATKTSIPDLDQRELRTFNSEVAKQISSEWTGLLSDPRYSELNDADKKKVLDRVNDTVFGASKSIVKPDTELNQRQLAYMNGEAVDWFDGFDKAAEVAKKAKKEATKTAKAKKGSTAKKSGGARKGKYDYAKLLESTTSDSQKNQTALRNLLKGITIKARKAQA